MLSIGGTVCTLKGRRVRVVGISGALSERTLLFARPLLPKGSMGSNPILCKASFWHAQRESSLDHSATRHSLSSHGRKKVILFPFPSFVLQDLVLVAVFVGAAVRLFPLRHLPQTRPPLIDTARRSPPPHTFIDCSRARGRYQMIGEQED